MFDSGVVGGGDSALADCDRVAAAEWPSRTYNHYFE